MIWVVCYDIPDDRRRKKIMKIMEGSGRRAQYSVFECELDAEKADRLEKRLRAELNEKEDDIRIYPLTRADLGRVRLLGRAELQMEKAHYIV